MNNDALHFHKSKIYNKNVDKSKITLNIGNNSDIQALGVTKRSITMKSGNNFTPIIGTFSPFIFIEFLKNRTIGSMNYGSDENKSLFQRCKCCKIF